MQDDDVISIIVTCASADILNVKQLFKNWAKAQPAIAFSITHIKPRASQLGATEIFMSKGMRVRYARAKCLELARYCRNARIGTWFEDIESFAVVAAGEGVWVR